MGKGVGILLMASEPQCEPRTCVMYVQAGRHNSRLFYLFLQWLHQHPYEFEQAAFSNFLLSSQGVTIHDPPEGLPEALDGASWDRIEYPPRSFVEQKVGWNGAAEDIILYHNSGGSADEKMGYMELAM